MRYDTVRVLGVPVDIVTESETLRFVAEAVEGRHVRQIVTVNAEFVMRARQDANFRHVLEKADLRTPDGTGVVWAARRRGKHVPARVGGSDLIWTISEQAARLGHRVFFLGGAPGVAEGTARRLAACYPGLIVAGTFEGSPRSEDSRDQVAEIRRSKPDVLFVAFGAPQQDEWIATHIELLGVPLAIGVGGSFDYVVGRARRAPEWMGTFGVEWLFRLLRQPRRWRRMLALPRFAVLAFVKRD